MFSIVSRSRYFTLARAQDQEYSDHLRRVPSEEEFGLKIVKHISTISCLYIRTWRVFGDSERFQILRSVGLVVRRRYRISHYAVCVGHFRPSSMASFCSLEVSPSSIFRFSFYPPFVRFAHPQEDFDRLYPFQSHVNLEFHPPL